MRYLSLSKGDAVGLHDMAIRETGGVGGILDEGKIEYALARLRMKVGEEEPFRTVFEKAAALLDSFARGHPFVDGNKRTGLLTATEFLRRNGCPAVGSAEILRHPERVEAFVLEVAEKKHSLEQIAAWLKDMCRL
jgi:death-on-curing protein